MCLILKSSCTSDLDDCSGFFGVFVCCFSFFRNMTDVDEMLRSEIFHLTTLLAKVLI